MIKNIEQLEEQADLIMDGMAYLINQDENYVLCIDCEDLEKRFSFDLNDQAVYASTMEPIRLNPYLSAFKRVWEDVLNA